MAGPQRHRLLQGYPQPGLMTGYDRARPYEPVVPRPDRPLIVGILPHAACAPSVKGCGYCTFPHEEFRASRVRDSVAAVRAELQASPLRGRRVEALYFGGGTANLTPADCFAALCRESETCFDLRTAEVSLEGAPAFFLSHNQALLEVLQGMDVGRLRVSMGVQTFQPNLLEAMGRAAIGSSAQVAKAARAARGRGISTSADLMINMPSQSLAQMKSDLQRASDLGFDQVCVYHLVLFRGLGTEWSRRKDMLQALPDNQRGFENWLEVTELARQLGYQQKTLTNFERAGNYSYENYSYQPEKFDGAGFGPAALSTYTDPMSQCAVKWMNETDGGRYVHALQQDGGAKAHCFVYGARDLRLLHLTRTLPRLRVSRPVYREFFGTDLVSDFSLEIEALETAELITVEEGDLSLTPRGMFFADSVAGLLANDRVGELRRGRISGANDSEKFHMG